MVGYPPSYAVRSARSVHDMARLGDLSPPTPSFEGLASHVSGVLSDVLSSDLDLIRIFCLTFRRRFLA